MEVTRRGLYDLVVIGGGPVGSQVATKVAKIGYKTLIIEEHSDIGYPVQCAGIVSHRLTDLVDINIPIKNRMNGAIFYPPNENPIILEDTKERAYVIDRAKFDNNLLDHAISEGSELMAFTRCTSITQKNDYMVIDLKTKNGPQKIRSKIVIGADGVNSIVRKMIIPKSNIEYLYGMQIEVPRNDLKNTSTDLVEIHVGRLVAPGFFAWSIPTDNGARIGLCTSHGKMPQYYLNKLLEKKGIMRKDHWPISAGTIPLGLLDRSVKDGIMLVGDAACHVKPLSAGGLYLGLSCAGYCAETAIKALESERYDSKYLSKYHQKWMKKFGKELKRGLLLRKVFLNLGDDQINKITDIFRSKELLSLLISKGDIDFPSKVAKAALIKSPKLLKFSPLLLKSLL